MKCDLNISFEMQMNAFRAAVSIFQIFFQQLFKIAITNYLIEVELNLIEKRNIYLARILLYIWC